jgi:hypothetical protein
MATTPQDAMDTAALVERVITTRLAEEDVAILLHDILREVIADKRGKKPSKHVATAFAKQLEDPYAKVRWYPRSGMFFVEVWDGLHNIPYDDRVKMLVAYDREETLDPARFDEHDAKNGTAARHRNERRRAFLKNGGPEKIASAINRMRLALESFMEMNDSPDWYGILCEMGWDALDFRTISRTLAGKGK